MRPVLLNSQEIDNNQPIVIASSSSKVPGSHSKNPLFPLMLMCKESESSKTDSHTRFVRIVTNSPQPMAVLVYDWTLRDMERFCAEPH